MFLDMPKPISNDGGGLQQYSECAVSLPSNREFVCGFKPKKVVVSFYSGSNYMVTVYYDESVSSTTCEQYFIGNNSYGHNTLNVEPSAEQYVSIEAITDTGFKMTQASIGSNCRNYIYLVVG